MSPNTLEVEVVVGLIFRQDTDCVRVLMQLRPLNKPRPGMWEMPGGKVEPQDEAHILNEATSQPLDRALCDFMGRPYVSRKHSQALRRELREELDVDVIVGPQIADVNFQWKQPVNLTLFHCLISEGQLTPKEATDMTWYPVEWALDSLAMSPAQYLFYPYVINYIDEFGKRVRAYDRIQPFLL